MSEFDFGTDVEETEERVGGGAWAADESNVYVKGITRAYLTQSAKGAFAMNLATKDKDGEERAYQFYFTNRAGQVYYTKDGKKRYLPGYSLLNAICMLTCGKPAKDVLSKPKKQVIDLMDWESRREVPTEVKTYPQICKKALKMGILQIRKNKFSKGKATNEEQSVNEISMVFESKTGLTITEKAKGETEPKLLQTWLETWEGEIDDQFKPVKEVEDEIESDGDEPFSDDDDSDSTDTTADTTDSDDDDDDDDDMFS